MDVRTCLTEPDGLTTQKTKIDSDGYHSDSLKSMDHANLFINLSFTCLTTQIKDSGLILTLLQ